MRPNHQTLGSRRGFTLLELLLSIGIISVLISILIPALGKAREMCRQVRELSAAHQVMTGFTAYADDSRGAVLVGYASKAMVKGPLVVVNNAGERMTNEVAQRFPWRLIPYLANDFKALYQDRKISDAILSNQNTYPDPDHAYDYVCSVYPSFGMNVCFVGGDDKQGEFGKTFLTQFGRVYVNQLHEVQRPSMLMAFASARHTLSAEELDLVPFLDPMTQGYFRVEPPIFAAAKGRLWDDQYDLQTANAVTNSGNVSLRYGGKGVASCFDGHAEMLNWEQFNDMRRWANAATTVDWGIKPK